ncbi:hypothetical protein SAMN04489712_12291 [Thermomonospora echinospora]|uniref:VWFA domain-containing protein n=1 Tax=Thermomonospora echinospora TaxID=1992 RepID=A0A1H6DVR4_9ACTN|nr:hypothetical protein [Thermomonospora echinospora]SEG88843.1 hypothetical protein SAMN04489712_12291 [Thermomonospora echinospora]
MPRYERDPSPCPVCFAPGGTGGTCGDCGWCPLPEGTPTREQERRLESAQRMFDAVAAARISPVEGRDLPYIRSSRPSDTEWATARRYAQVDTDSAEGFRDRLHQVLAGMPDQGRLSIVEAGETGITVTVVGVDGFGLPRSRRRPTVPWRDLVPMLAAGPVDEPAGGPVDELRFRLAGGFGGVDRIRLWAELERNLTQRLPLPDGHQIMPVCTASGWPVPERALAMLGRGRTQDPPTRLAGGDVAAVVSETVAALPLRGHLELVVVRVDRRTGQVHPDGVRLFAAGDQVGTERSLTFRCVHPHPDGTVLAVATWRDDGPRVLSIGSVHLPEGEHRLRAVLAGAGRIKFLDPAGITPEHRPWSELMATLPDRLAPQVAELDVVCLVDLSGDGSAARRRLAAEFVKLAARRLPEPGRLRVAVIGYGRHDFRMEAEDAGVLQGKWLAPPAAALDTLDRLRQVWTDRIPSAPVEDALHQVAKRITTIPPERKVVMLTLGERPPHPPRDDPSGMLPCPHGHDWGSLLRRVQRHPGLLSVAVLDSAEHLTPAWRRIGGDALLRLDRTDAHKLAAVTRIVVPESGRLAFPLPASEG